MSREITFTIKLNDIEKGQLERVADAYDCSQSAAARMLFSNQYENLFGDLHPEAFERPEIDMDELVRGDLDPEGLDEKYKLRESATPEVPAADGGLSAAISPGKHTPIQTPQDLATSGRELSWEELTDAVESYWSDSLEIHPDRVDPEVLKNNKRLAPKIVAGVIRHETDAVSIPLIEQKIEEYLGHKVTAADYEAGLERKISGYKPEIRQHFVSHPNQDDGRQYTTPEARERGVPYLAELTIDSLKEKIAAVDFETWRKTNVTGSGVVLEDVRKWVDDLAEYRDDIATLSAITTTDEFRDALVDSSLEYPEEYNGPIHYASAITRNRLESYESANPFARYVATHTVLEYDDTQLVDVDRPQTAAVKFETGEPVSEAEQFQVVAGKLLD